MLLEAETAGFGASGRNGGFLAGSLTHGYDNGMARFAAEMPALERLAATNFDDMLADLERLRIDCDLERTGHLDVALEPHQVEWLAESGAKLRVAGHDVELLDAEAMRA